jgi:hypothetical protein
MKLSMEHWRNDTAENQVPGEKPVIMPPSPLQISHRMNWGWARTSAVIGQQLTTWSMAQSNIAHWNSDQGKDSARTAQWTHPVSDIKTSQLMLCGEIIAVCSKSRTKYINTLCGQNVEFLNVKPNGKYNHHRALMGALSYNNLYEFLKRTRYILNEPKTNLWPLLIFRSFKTSLICDKSVATQNIWFFRRKVWRFWSAIIFYECNDDKTALQRRVLQTALWPSTY